MPDEESSIGLDLANLTARSLKQELANLAASDPAATATITVPANDEVVGLLAGLNLETQVRISGDVGSYLYCTGQQASIDLKGSCQDCCGHSMASGAVLIRKNAADYLGAYSQGGFIAVYGRVGRRCGFQARGTEFVIRGSAGDEAGCSMQNGILVIGNGAGKELGRGMTGGTIYLRGEAKSVSNTLKPFRLKDADKLRLSLLLTRAGIKATSADFRGFRVPNPSATPSGQN